MTALTRDEIVVALGPLSDIEVSDILATQATAEEFHRAVAWLANDEPLINAGDHLASGRVARLIGLLESMDADPMEEAPRV